MFSLSVVLPVLRDQIPAKPELDRFREALEVSGRFESIELLLVVGQDGFKGFDGDGVRCIEATERGMVSLAHAGLRAATGELAVVVDSRQGYGSDSVLKVLDPVIAGDADVAVGLIPSRKSAVNTDSPAAGANVTGSDGAGRIGGILRPMLGTAAPFSGLIGLRRNLADEALSSVAARAKAPSAGSFFVLDLVSRLPGKRVDVPVERENGVRMRRPGLNDVRQVKSLLDERFGNYSRLVQFCLVGASGMIVDLSLYAFFQWLFSRPWLFLADSSLFGNSGLLATAGGLSIFFALIWNFSLNRRLTFNDAMKGNLLHQFVAYALGNALGVILSFTLRLYLPAHVAFFNEHKLAAAVVGIVAATGISFTMSRWVVFSNQKEEISLESSATDSLSVP